MRTVRLLRSKKLRTSTKARTMQNSQSPVKCVARATHRGRQQDVGCVESDHVARTEGAPCKQGRSDFSKYDYSRTFPISHHFPLVRVAKPTYHFAASTQIVPGVRLIHTLPV